MVSETDLTKVGSGFNPELADCQAATEPLLYNTHSGTRSGQPGKSGPLSQPKELLVGDPFWLLS